MYSVRYEYFINITRHKPKVNTDFAVFIRLVLARSKTTLCIRQ